MPKLDAVDSISIQAPADKVFEAVLDYANHHAWWKHYQCEVEGGGPVKEGTRVRHVINIPVIQPKPNFVRTIRKIVPNERIEETYDEGDYVGTGVWTFERQGALTVATFTCHARSNNLINHIGVGLMGAGPHHSVYKTGLAGLKARCEGQA
ncbi:MAG: SRPBCC family protein [Deltaproteobacteria bacterium]|nr:SRPBCC family protein [Deltaproteobacteria bacterium]